ncbi:hypothetical protein LIA77_03301 [Sarocladium implicatum]|nr:hypothetical protein LIA77_03301 [Sarocladium implicatum]
MEPPCPNQSDLCLRMTTPGYRAMITLITLSTFLREAYRTTAATPALPRTGAHGGINMVQGCHHRAGLQLGDECTTTEAARPLNDHGRYVHAIRLATCPDTVGIERRCYSGDV